MRLSDLVCPMLLLSSRDLSFFPPRDQHSDHDRMGSWQVQVMPRI